METINILYIDDFEDQYPVLADSIKSAIMKNDTSQDNKSIKDGIHYYKISNEKILYNLFCCQDLERVLYIIENNEIQLFFIDYELAKGVKGTTIGTTIYKKEKEKNRNVYQVMLTAYGEVMIEALRTGVFKDFITKEQLCTAKNIQGIFARFEAFRKLDEENKILIGKNKELQKINDGYQYEIIELKNKVQSQEELLERFDKKIKVDSKKFESLKRNIIGSSKGIERVKYFIQKYAETDDNVLIIGETGTGKDLVAEAIHELSRRKNNKFKPINCAAISEGTIESELFGHKKGAFTGADRDRIGIFEEADGGTIFLDEIDRMNKTGQAKLLRLIEDQKVIKMGELDIDAKKVDVRIIAAIKPDALNKVGGEFLTDLYGRLVSLFPIIPPLKDRKEDIPLLINHFIDLIGWEQYRILRRGDHNKLTSEQFTFEEYTKLNKGKLFSFDEEGVRLLADYDWNRNVRELRKFVENIFTVFVEDKKNWNNELVSTDDVRRAFLFHKTSLTSEEQELLDSGFNSSQHVDTVKFLDQIEEIVITYYLHEKDNSVDQTKIAAKFPNPEEPVRIRKKLSKDGKSEEEILAAVHGKEISISRVTFNGKFNKHKETIKKLFDKNPDNWKNARKKCSFF